MSDVLGHVATAALPVAIGLALLAVAARVTLGSTVEDLELRRLARQHLEPLCTWCLIATAAYIVGKGGAGDLGLTPVAMTLVLVSIGVGLRPAADSPAVERRGPPEVVEQSPWPVPAAPDAPTTPPAPAATAATRAATTTSTTSPTGSLWANASGEDDHRGQGLWSR